MTWGIDENLSASGPRFTGKTPDEWRRGTSYRVTFSNNIIAEGVEVFDALRRASIPRARSFTTTPRTS